MSQDEVSRTSASWQARQPAARLHKLCNKRKWTVTSVRRQAWPTTLRHHRSHSCVVYENDSKQAGWVDCRVSTACGVMWCTEVAFTFGKWRYGTSAAEWDGVMT